MKTLRNLFLDQLADIYEAERRIVRALPKMIKTASGEALQMALRFDSYQTESHISKVERVFECFSVEAEHGEGHAIAGLLYEGRVLIFNQSRSPAVDAAIIAAMQKIEHYEIASYGCLRDWARLLENNEAEMLLQEILDEEKSADRTLTDLAQMRNAEAVEGSCSMASGVGDSERIAELAHSHHPK